MTIKTNEEMPGHHGWSFQQRLRWGLLLLTTIFCAVSVRTHTLLGRQSEKLLDKRGTFFEEHDLIVGEWNYPFVHIINTRFMQQQSELVELARARLMLFRIFCLPTIVQQTLLLNQTNTNKWSSPFLWIIKMDPDLDASVRDELITFIEPYPYIYLVASNTNYGIGQDSQGGWRGGQAGEDIFNSTIYSGNIQWLEHAHAAREKRAVLETRLDADDGLNTEFMERVQLDAKTKLHLTHHQVIHHPRAKWRYWCGMNHLEWNPIPLTASAGNHSASDYGVLIARKSAQECVTPGITIGLSVAETQDSYPVFMHHKLYYEIEVNKNHNGCGDPKCLKMISKPFMTAIRARTPTSAGMKNVVKNDKDLEKIHGRALPFQPAEMDKSLRLSFNVHIQSLVEASKYLRDHFTLIVEENLKGQCTQGHSCKNGTKDSLSAMLQKAKEMN